ncbi:nuclear transport factor 2 family protein [Streptosporangium sandarakinum]|uniref:nuclear transport factor 2 family protein n=1 Tax=Streptosporangium TaxID=2000 RepID=UPI0031F8E59E
MIMPAMPAAVMQFFTASQAGDTDAWANAFAENGIFHDPVGQPPIVGRTAIRDFIAGVLPAFQPFLGLTAREVHIVGGSVAVAWSGAAIAANGTAVNWSGINIYDLDQDGLIREAKAYFNRSIFQAQLSN